MQLLEPNIERWVTKYYYLPYCECLAFLRETSFTVLLCSKSLLIGSSRDGCLVISPPQLS